MKMRKLRNAQIAEQGLRVSLQVLLDSDQHPGQETIAILTDLQYLDCLPDGARPLLKAVLEKFPLEKRKGRFDIDPRERLTGKIR